MNWSKQERSKAKHVSRSRTVHNWRSEEHIHIAHHASPKQKSDTVDAIVAVHRGGASAGGPRQSAPAVAQGRTAGATSQAASTYRLRLGRSVKATAFAIVESDGELPHGSCDLCKLSKNLSFVCRFKQAWTETKFGALQAGC
jgi:hypothetical protein